MVSRTSGDVVDPSGARPRLLVVVLGYAARPADRLHPVCAARVERAVAEIGTERAVLLSGGRSRRSDRPESELMLQRWPRADALLDSEAKTTAHAAVRAGALARQLGAEEVRVVTSEWHMRRSLFIFRCVLRSSGVRLSAASVADRPDMRRVAREVLSWALLPIELPRRLLLGRLGR